MRQLLSLVTRQHSHLLYTLLLVQRNRWFANSDVPFQSVTNDLLHSQFAIQTYVLHQVDVTSELSHSAHVQSNNKTINVWLFGICTHLLLVSLIKIEHSAFGLMVIFYQLDRKLVCTNSMLHTEPYITFACSA